MPVSTYFFLGRLTPTERCFFLWVGKWLVLGTGTNVLVSRDPLVIEVERWAFDFDPLRNAIGQSVGNLLACHTYYTRGEVALTWQMTQWIEAASVPVSENIVGFRDLIGRTLPQDPCHPDNMPLVDAVKPFSLVDSAPALRLALKDFRAASAGTGDDTAQFSFRCIEDIRRYYQDGISDRDRVAAWAAMHAELGTSQQQLGEIKQS